jgi:alcohol dehydrogenase (cytochrome c)
MKKILGAIALLAAAHSTLYAQSSQDLARDGRGGNTDNVLTYGMGYHQQRYSTLKQISKSNVKRLVPVWSTSLSSNYGEQGQPLVYDGVMFVANAEHTIAIDVATGKQLWRTPVEFDPATPRVVC